MKAITSVVRFITAQFKDHTQKLVRRTYLIPPPSAVAGFFGAILGLSRKELWENSDKLLAGAELRSLEGRAVSICRIFKIDRPIKSLIRLLEDYHKLGTLSERKRKEVINGIQGLLTIKESEELYMAEYKFAVASTNEQLIEEGAERLKELDFEYEVFGGNDYNFVEYVGGVRRAKLIKSTKGRGYCKLRDFEKLETDSFHMVWNLSSQIRQPLILPVRFREYETFEEYIQAYGAEIVACRALDTVDDGESRIFVYRVRPFLVMEV